MTKEQRWEIEWKLLYSVIVAGKSAKFAENATDKFLCNMIRGKEGPFDYLKAVVKLEILDIILKLARTGSYTRIKKCFEGIIELNPVTCTVEALEAIHGIGPKTARFFVMWTREDQNYAALDTHILKWMKYLGYNVPKSTPSGKKYALIEKQFLAEAEKRSIGARDLDAMIWEYCSNGGHKSGEWHGILEKLSD